MKLIRQAILAYNEGRSDKVYEVDLCEVGADQFVVNFRYGRRGSSLRDGTKTPAPVEQSKAEKIFDDLVASKVKKGYSDSGSAPGQTPAPIATNAPDVPRVNDPMAQAILNRITKGSEPDRWKLSRAIWRAGELRIREAEVAIARHIGTGDAMLDYSIAAALSRIGSPECLLPLDGISRNPSLPNHVRRMADEAKRQICSDADRTAFISAGIDLLPVWCQSLARSGPAESFSSAWREKISQQDREAIEAIDRLYFIDNEHVRPALLETLRTVPFEPSFFRHIRRIYKSAELRDDAEVFGLLAGRFAKERHTFVMPDSWYFRGSRKKPTVGDNAQKAYSKQTREYLRRRVWRTLDRLGRARDSEYCSMATAVLLQFHDDDAQSITSYTTWEPPSYRAEIAYCDRYGRYWALSNILYGNSDRYRPVSKKLRFHCRRSFNPNEDDSATKKREEAFPHLWDEAPELLVRLLQESHCEKVHEFAGLALIENQAFCARVDLQVLIDLLSSEYESTCSFALDAVTGRYDPNHPDRQLVLALANCALQRARTQAHRYIEVQRTFFFEDPAFAFGVIASPHADTRLFARDCFRVVQVPSHAGETIVRMAIDHLLELSEDEQDRLAAGDITVTLSSSFSRELRKVGDEAIEALLDHPLEGVQLLGCEIVSRHETYSRQPPAELLHKMFSSQHATVRGMAVQIVNQIWDGELRQSMDLLFALTRHPLEDVRNEIRPTVKRILGIDSRFANTFADRLIAALLTPGAAEGVPSHTARVLIEDLGDRLSHVDASTVWKLLQSRSQPAQDVGGTLLATNVKPDSLSVEELVKLASHDVLSVREASWKMCGHNIERLRKSMASTVRLLDAKWEDSRDFGFKLFRESFADDDLSADVLVSICDSVREDVQRFGCDLISKRFEEDDGQTYLLKLSEHPSAALQLFTTNFLERYAADHPERLQSLTPYFMSVLTRVNKARVAKDRVLALLANEAGKNEQSARAVSEIVAHVSATAAIGDRARTLEVMAEIREQYPTIELPIEIQTVEVR